ncbi:PREDICTED: uncharacterized protein LOC108761948 [Trachymyrmex cornetzi]|uniref:uncharacterized protein LOC108761948 n=1 Tax=Trachymyrmex cornetzi TaxID=471704 RepID=UPI00084F4479|nr:PREDICTED: uncharacterized protein LOC108761948 [Trachymyrmex cornetzi]
METAVHPFQTQKMIILGDFNARSKLWDVRNFNVKGEMVIDLANALNVRLINKRYVSTCVRTQGESTVDLTWATPVTGINENNGKIREDIIMLSDHRLIEISNEEEMAKKLGNIYKLASDMAMPRKRIGTKRSIYWWNDNLKEMRKECMKIRRKITRAKRKNNPVITENLKREYRQIQHDFKAEIMVMNKLRPATIPLMESMDRNFVIKIVNELFPAGRRREPTQVETDWNEIWNISNQEIQEVIKRMGTKNKAPGPDGLWKGVIRKSTDVMETRWRDCFQKSLETGKFPKIWKTAKLVLLKKPGKPDEVVNSHRPIYLLNEGGKLFERLLAKRINEFLEVNSGLSDNQYGFRAKRSTIDAVSKLREIAEQATNAGKTVVAVSIDIKNAFNSIPWEQVMTAMGSKNVSTYLRNVISDYLSSRWIVFTDEDQKLAKMPFDAILEEELPDKCFVLCYADDTLVVVNRDNIAEATSSAELAMANIANAIERLGLTIATNKTEAVVFVQKKIPRPLPAMDVRGKLVQIATRIKYLGLHIDSKWTFANHFQQITGRINAVANALHKLMPNLRGPAEKNYLPGTVAYEAVIILARFIPIEILADKYRNLYLRKKDLRKRGVELLRREVEVLKNQAIEHAIAKWKERSQKARGYGIRVREAVLPHFEEWIARGHGRLDFHTTQMITGHGCFAYYLKKIRKIEPANCSHCSCNLDNAHAGGMSSVE